MYEEQRQQIRRKIKPGNSKTLWESVKIASDKEITIIPDQMHINNVPVKKDERSESFAHTYDWLTKDIVTSIPKCALF